MPSRKYEENGEGFGDSYSPAFVDIDPATGQVSFDFTGRIHAEGLDLPSHDIADGFGFAALTENAIRWQKESDGAVVAQQYALHNPAVPARRMFHVGAGNDAENDYVRFFLDHNGVNTSAWVEMEVAGAGDSALILNADGGSTFVKVDTAIMGIENMRVGIYTVNHNPGNILAGGIGVEDLALPSGSLSVGDFSFCVGINGLPNGISLQRCHGICLAADTSRIYLRNNTAAAIDPAAADYYVATLRLV